MIFRNVARHSYSISSPLKFNFNRTTEIDSSSSHLCHSSIPLQPFSTSKLTSVSIKWSQLIMDLRGLMGSKEGPGHQKGGGRKENLKKVYKKPGTSTDVARSLRTIQVTRIWFIPALSHYIFIWIMIEISVRCLVHVTPNFHFVLILNFKTFLSNSVFFTFVMHECKLEDV